MLKIAFIIPAFEHRIFNENVAVVDRDFGTFPDLGTCYAASIARAWGAEVKIWDGRPEGLSAKQAARQVKAFNPDLLAFPIHAIPAFKDTLDWIKRIRKEIGKPVVVGGYEFSFFQEEYFVHKELDFGFYGEVLRSLPAFLDAFTGAENYEGIKGLIYRKEGKTIVNPAPEANALDEFPFPARDLLKNNLYFSHVSQRKNYTVILSSKGCPYSCSFCALASTGFYARSPASVIDEMLECYHDHDIREFDFFDPLMLHDRERAVAIAEEIIRSGMDIMWSCRSRIDTVDRDMLGILARSGLERIFYGIESVDQAVLKKMKKGYSADAIRNVIEFTVASGIRPLGFFQVGAPGDTEESVKKTVEFARSLPLDYAQFMRTIAKPNSELEKQMNESLGYDYWREYIMGKREDMRLPAPWTELDNEKIESLIKQAYISFYFRPAYIAKMLGKVTSVSELQKYFRAAFRMLLTRPGL